MKLFVKILFCISLIVFFQEQIISQEPEIQEEQSGEKPKLWKNVMQKFKKSNKGEQSAGEGMSQGDSTSIGSTRKKKKFNWKFWKKKKDPFVTEEKKWETGQDLEPDESEKVDEWMDKYQLSKEEQQIKSMWKSGEPLNKKGRKKLRKLKRKETKRIAKIRKFHIKRNREIQEKEVQKRMKKNRRKSNRRIRKRTR